MNYERRLLFAAMYAGSDAGRAAAEELLDRLYALEAGLLAALSHVPVWSPLRPRLEKLVAVPSEEEP